MDVYTEKRGSNFAKTATRFIQFEPRFSVYTSINPKNKTVIPYVTIEEGNNSNKCKLRKPIGFMKKNYCVITHQYCVITQ